MKSKTNLKSFQSKQKAKIKKSDGNHHKHDPAKNKNFKENNKNSRN